MRLRREDDPVEIRSWGKSGRASGKRVGTVESEIGITVVPRRRRRREGGGFRGVAAGGGNQRVHPLVGVERRGGEVGEPEGRG